MCLALCQWRLKGFDIGVFPCVSTIITLGQPWWIWFRWGGWGLKMEPFAVLLALESFLPSLRPIPAMRPSLVWLHLLSFCGHFRWLWVLESPFTPLSPKSPFPNTPRTLRFKGKMCKSHGKHEKMRTYVSMVKHVQGGLTGELRRHDYVGGWIFPKRYRQWCHPSNSSRNITMAQSMTTTAVHRHSWSCQWLPSP